MATYTDLNASMLITATPLDVIEHLCAAIVSTDAPDTILTLAQAIRLLAEAAVMLEPIVNVSVSISE